MKDQNTFQSEKWGTLQFFPTKTNKWADNCRHCLLWTREQGQTDECLRALCNPDERDDHRRGYYSIHQMPSQSKKCLTNQKNYTNEKISINRNRGPHDAGRLHQRRFHQMD